MLEVCPCLAEETRCLDRVADQQSAALVGCRLRRQERLLPGGGAGDGRLATPGQEPDGEPQHEHDSQQAQQRERRAPLGFTA